MRNITGQAVIGDDLYGREYELNRLWEMLEQGEHILMLAPRRVGKTSLMLELHRAPRENWDVFYVDVEACKGPADCIAAVLAALAANPQYRSRFEAMPFSAAVKDIFSRLSISTDIGAMRVELANAIGRDWDRAASQLQTRLTSLPDTERHLLIIFDELPFLLSRMLRTGGHEHETELLLSHFRHWRQAPELRGKVHTLVGGSIGLEGVLRRAGLSGSINDLTPFRLESWDKATAVKFLSSLGHDYNFNLRDESVEQVLGLLGDPVPYHLQLFFSALRDTCQGDARNVSAHLIAECFADRLAGPSGTAHLDHYAKRLDFAFDEDEHRTALDVLSRACRRDSGVPVAELEDLRQQNEPAFRSVLRDLETDGYLRRGPDETLRFRSNLLRQWWRKYHGRYTAP